MKSQQFGKVWAVEAEDGRVGISRECPAENVLEVSPSRPPGTFPPSFAHLLALGFADLVGLLEDAQTIPVERWNQAMADARSSAEMAEQARDEAHRREMDLKLDLAAGAVECDELKAKLELSHQREEMGLRLAKRFEALGEEWRVEREGLRADLSIAQDEAAGR